MLQEEKSVLLEVIISAILSKKKVYMYMCPIPNGFRDRAMDVIALIQSVKMHSDEQHAMSSQQLQSALMLTVEFLKMYYTR
jgi:hypothetical protein